MKGFKKCDNGHYYKDTFGKCPYCPNSGENTEQNSGKSNDNSNLGGDSKTEVFGGYERSTSEGNGESSTMIDVDLQDSSNMGTESDGSRTVFGDELETTNEAGKVTVEKEYRSSRMLVGWLVSYTIDKFGVDFKLYEGRNTIGRGNDCNIRIDDPTISSKNSVILFRGGKYKIADEMSTHGTFVNNVDIEDNHVELKDGDTIKIGETILKFRTSM